MRVRSFIDWIFRWRNIFIRKIPINKFKWYFAVAILAIPVQNGLTQDQYTEMRYVYGSVSSNPGFDRGFAAVGLGDYYRDQWGSYGTEFGVSYRWISTQPEEEPRGFLGLEASMYWGTGSRIEPIGGIQGAIATDLWFVPAANPTPPDDDIEEIGGIVTVVPFVGLIGHFSTSVSLQTAFRVVGGLATDQGAFINPEFGVTVRVGGLFGS